MTLPGNAAAEEQPPERGVLRDICATGVWRVLPLMFIYVTGLAVVAPQIPGLMTDYMASRREGRDIQCELFRPHEQPDACRNAYSDVVWWSSTTSFFTNSVLTFLMAPVVGTWSDVVGRKPFLLVAMSFGSAPLLVLLCHLTLGTSLLFYYPACALGGCVSIISITLAYVADLLTPCHRAAGFGALMASFSVGILIGPAVGSLMDAITAAYVACGLGLSCVLYVIFLVPESLTETNMAEAQQKQKGSGGKMMERANGLRILLRSPLFKRLTVCLMVSGIVTDGLSDLLIQYFKLLFNFSIQDVTAVFEMFGVCGLVVQTVVLRYALMWLGETRVLTLGLVAALLEMLLVGFLTAKWQAFGAVALGSLGGMAFPAISSIKANNVADCEQGTIQGALYGAKALATGVGPLMFAAMFAAFTKTDSPLPYFPGAPFLFGSALMLVAIGFALSIDNDAGKALGGGSREPLLPCSEDPEAAAHHQNTNEPDDLAELGVPNEGIVRGDILNENLEALIVRGASPHPKE